MLCPGYDFVLKLGRKVNEIGAVASYSYEEVPIFFGISLGIFQCLSIDYIELYMPVFLIAPGSDK